MGRGGFSMYNSQETLEKINTAVVSASPDKLEAFTDRSERLALAMWGEMRRRPHEETMAYRVLRRGRSGNPVTAAQDAAYMVFEAAQRLADAAAGASWFEAYEAGAAIALAIITADLQ